MRWVWVQLWLVMDSQPAAPGWGKGTHHWQGLLGLLSRWHMQPYLRSTAHVSPVGRMMLQRKSHSEYQGKMFKAYSCLLWASACPPAALLLLLPGRGGWGQAELVTQGRSRRKNSVLCEWEAGVSCANLLFVASEPSLLCATWICPAALLGSSSMQVFARTWAVAFPSY